LYQVPRNTPKRGALDNGTAGVRQRNLA
jgi:hypothetical protein